MKDRLHILRNPAQLSGAVIGLIAGWAIALVSISKALLYKPLAIATGVVGGMLIGWIIWLAVSLSLFLRRQAK